MDMREYLIETKNGYNLKFKALANTFASYAQNLAAWEDTRYPDALSVISIPAYLNRLVEDNGIPHEKIQYTAEKLQVIWPGLGPRLKKFGLIDNVREVVRLTPTVRILDLDTETPQLYSIKTDEYVEITKEAAKLLVDKGQSDGESAVAEIVSHMFQAATG